MANEEQLSILRQGVDVWNQWRSKNRGIEIDLREANLIGENLSQMNFINAKLNEANLNEAKLIRTSLEGADLSGAYLCGAKLLMTNLSRANLRESDFGEADLYEADLSKVTISRTYFDSAEIDSTMFADVDLRGAIGLEAVKHSGPSTIGTDTLVLSKGKIPEAFLRGCGLSDWEIEVAKLYNPDLSNEELNNIQYKMYDLRATQALQISPLFISYSHADNLFADKIGDRLTQKGIRHWRDIHDAKAGRLEKQIDRAIRQNPTVLLVLSEHSLSSDWVEHEVRTSRGLEKEIGRDVLCPVALDGSWRTSRWPKRIMEQIMEYNILDFSEWKDDSKFADMFRKLIVGLELFYKG